jgi:hypothetical protein
MQSKQKESTTLILSDMSFSDLHELLDELSLTTENDASFGTLGHASLEQMKHLDDMRSKIDEAKQYRRRPRPSTKNNEISNKKDIDLDDIAISTHSCGDYHRMMRTPH